MDCNWLQWRYYERLWEEFEYRGWELGPVRYVNLPSAFAEFGPYRIMFRYREPATDEGLFEVRRIHEGYEREVILVWGVPTPHEAQSLLQRYGVEQLGETSEETLNEALACGASRCSEGSWESLLPPVVYAESFSGAPGGDSQKMDETAADGGGSQRTATKLGRAHEGAYMRQEVGWGTRDTRPRSVSAKRGLIRTLERGIGKNIERVRQHIERSHRAAFAREMAAETERDEAWLEAVERERSQAREIESVQGEGLRNAAVSKSGAVLVAHSGGSGETLERLAREGAYLADVVSDGGSGGIDKSWLVFKESTMAPRQRVAMTASGEQARR
ncbi:hypothetical protein [Rubrobacter aplysinae]|uniref:hypothetical protein n=1 Tax=Rubrobacter aplysinae TaxID=909625 RepID=UPI00064B9B98|nr:hypothetical protein [Rubrobacter aplysinae]